jgi:hypothetical protein
MDGRPFLPGERIARSTREARTNVDDTPPTFARTGKQGLDYADCRQCVGFVGGAPSGAGREPVFVVAVLTATHFPGKRAGYLRRVLLRAKGDGTQIRNPAAS